MTKPIYTTNYRRNLTLYWQQYFPNYKIPKGYHVHHIKPKCTFENKTDPAIHHPKNLIALHIDDHILIHECRGDIAISSMLYSIKGRICIVTAEHRRKISKTLTGRRRPPFSKEHLHNMSQAQLGKKHGPRSNKHKDAISVGNSGMNSYHFKGYYHTPFGKFATLKEAVFSTNIKPNPATLKRYCINSNKILTTMAYNGSNFLRLISKENIGLTFREIGFYYEYI